MTTPELLAELASAGVVLGVDGDRLTYDAPAGVMAPERLELVKSHKAELLGLVGGPPAPQLESRAEREVKRFMAVCRPTPDGRGWYDPGEVGLPTLLARVDAPRAQVPAGWCGPPPTLYDVDGQKMTFVQRAAHWRKADEPMDRTEQ